MHCDSPFYSFASHFLSFSESLRAPLNLLRLRNEGIQSPGHTKIHLKCTIEAFDDVATLLCCILGWHFWSHRVDSQNYDGSSGLLLCCVYDWLHVLLQQLFRLAHVKVQSRRVDDKGRVRLDFVKPQLRAALKSKQKCACVFDLPPFKESHMYLLSRAKMCSAVCGLQPVRVN